jgi:predicted Rossmann fold flavoprotein
MRRLARSGATLALAEPVTALARESSHFVLQTPGRSLHATSVILTTGGMSYPGSGTTGDGYRIAAQFGHTIIPPRPALVPITTTEAWVSSLRGITIPDVRVQVTEVGKCLDSRRGSLLFAHFGLSGPVILDLSRTVSAQARPETLQLQLDFLPDRSEAELIDRLIEASRTAGKKHLAGILGQYLPRRLAEVLLAQAGLPVDRTAAGLPREARAGLVQKIKKLQISIAGTLGFGKAEVTAGGVDLKEVDSRTMRSKLVEGLFLAGEVLDLDGPIGGFNFQAAWSTGWLAGSSV